MADLDYAYANARVKAMRSNLLDRDRLREIMDVRTLPEVIELLEESPYKKYFVAASTRHSGIELVKHALDDNLAASFRKVWEIAPAKAKPLLEALLKQWEVNNLKKALASKALGRKIAVSDLVMIGDSGSNRLLERVVAAEGLEEAVRALESSEYGVAVKKAFAEYRKSRDFRVLLSALDDFYYSLLSKAMNSTGVDQLTKNFLEHKLGYASAMAVLRMKHSGVPSQKIRSHLVRGGALWKLLDRIVSVEGSQQAAEVLSQERFLDGQAVREKASKNDLAGIEVELEKALLKLARKTLSKSVLSMGALVGYLFLKQEEVHALRKIAYATQFEVRREIRETILAAA